MTANFDFLRNFDNNLHYLAEVIEDEIYDSPSAVLCDATTFLEIIVYEIFKNNNVPMDSLRYFNDKITVLCEMRLISLELKNAMQKAYSFRNKMHSYNGDAKNHIMLNKNRAINIHKHLFNASWLYFKEHAKNSKQIQKPSYTHPSKFKNEIFEQSEISTKRCIICGEKTKSEDKIFCSECDYKLEKADNLKTLRKHFGFKEGFKKNRLIEIGYDKGNARSILLELKNEDLINTVSQLNYIDKENATRYIKEAEAMIAVEKLLSDFNLKKIDLKEILSNEMFQLGKLDQYPYVGLYKLFSQMQYMKFEEKITEDITLEEALNEGYLTLDEVNQWFMEEMDKNSDKYKIFAKKLLDECFTYKKKGLAESEIKILLNIDDEIINAIINSGCEYYTRKVDDYRFSLFMKSATQERVTKNEALKNAGLSKDDLCKIIEKYPELRVRFKKHYTKRKMEKFLKHFDYYNYNFSLKKNGLTREDIREWLEKGKSGDDTIYSEFLKDYNNQCLETYIKCRKHKKTRKKALNNIQSTEDEIKRLLGENEKYKDELDSILISYTIEEFNKGKTKDAVINRLDLDPDWINEAITKGEMGCEKYSELFDAYSDNALRTDISSFLELIKIKPLKNVLNEVNISESELNSWYIKGKNGDETFKDFYDEFFSYKKETYIKSMLKADNTSKALKKSYLNDDEFKEYESELNREIHKRSVEIVCGELEKGNTTRQATTKVPLNVKDIYGWLEEGLNGNGEYSEFVEIYKKEYLIPIKKAYEEGIKEGIKEKAIIKTLKQNKFLIEEDYKHLKRLNLFPKPEDVVLEMDEDFEVNLDE